MSVSPYGGVNVAAFVRLALEHFRAQGLPFETAWVRALQAIPRGPNITVARERREWVAALRWSKPAWQAAYELAALELYLPASPARRVSANVAELRELIVG